MLTQRWQNYFSSTHFPASFQRRILTKQHGGERVRNRPLSQNKTELLNLTEHKEKAGNLPASYLNLYLCLIAQISGLVAQGLEIQRDIQSHRFRDFL